MTVFLNILFVLSILGILIACSYGDAADGCCGCPGVDWMDDRAQANDRKIAAWVGTTSVIIFAVVIRICIVYKIPLLGLFN